MADARHIPLADKSVQCVVTSPPYYGLRNYGVEGQLGLEKTYLDYVKAIVEVFRELWRVLRDDGTVWLNLGDSFASGKGTCFNPCGNTSSFNVHLKAENVHPLDRGNKSTLSAIGLKPKDLIGIPWRVAFALQADGWYLRSDIIWSKPNPMPESVTDRPTKAHEYIFLLSKSERYYFDQDAVKEKFADERMGNPGVYKKTSSTDRKACNDRQDLGFINNGGGWTKGQENGGRNIRTVWEVATQPFSEAHFATFPEDLIKPCILAGAPAGGIVFDPFVGSGTVVKVAQDLGRIGVGLDLKTEYLQMAKRRSAQQGFGSLLREAP